jgi:SAM-dependent methyltransferase
MDNPRPTSRSWKLFPFFEHAIRGAGPVLNLGSGDGYLSWYLRERTHYGKSIRIEDLDVADHATTGRRPRIFDGEVIPFPDDHFDVTLCMYVLHHTPDAGRLIGEIRRVTRRFVVVAEDLAETPLDRALCLYHAIRFDRWNTRSGRFGFRTHDGWVQGFAEAGFRLERSHRLPRFSHLTSKAYPVRRALLVFEREGRG